MADEELIARLRERRVKGLPDNWQEGRKCPDCGIDAKRPKCAFDHGPSCARHNPDAYDPPAWDVSPDPLTSEAADRIGALLRECEIRDAATQEGKRLWAEAEARAARLEAENAALREQVAEMLAAQECGCGYDKPTDVCLGHLPLHRKTVARAERLEAALRGIVDHDLFHDEQYLSADLVAKLEAARAALTQKDQANG